MKEYIERAAVLTVLEKTNSVDFGSMFDYKAHGAVSECLREIRYGVENIPAADVVEVRHRRWVFEHMTGELAYYAHCSECGIKKHFSSDVAERKEKYCSSCGACMDKEDKHEDD